VVKTTDTTLIVGKGETKIENPEKLKDAVIETTIRSDIEK